MDSRIDCFFIRETEKARLLQISDTEEALWIPKSVTNYFMKGEIPEGMEGKIPGQPCLIKVEMWFQRKNPEAFGL